jgi:hypothetical protein
MSDSLVFSCRVHYLRASNPKSEGGDASDIFANEELLPMIPSHIMMRKWRRTKKTNKRQGVRNT